jgi:hypothetical protein
VTSQVDAFEAREGGRFRISLTYDAPTGTGKTTAPADRTAHAGQYGRGGARPARKAGERVVPRPPRIFP